MGWEEAFLPFPVSPIQARMSPAPTYAPRPRPRGRRRRRRRPSPPPAVPIGTDPQPGAVGAPFAPRDLRFLLR